MSTARKILGSTISQFFGKLIVGLLSIIVIKLLTGYLTQSQYGDYNFIYDFLAVFGIIADLGLYTVAVREMSKDESKIEILLGNILTIRTFVGIIAMLTAIGVGFFIPIYMPWYATAAIPYGIAIASVTVLLAILNGTLTSVLQVHYRMRESAIAAIIGKVISIAYIAYIVLIALTQDASTGFYHVIAAGVIGNAAMLIYTYWYTRRFTHIAYRFDWNIIRDVFIKALPYGLALMLSTIYFRLNTILLYNIKGPEEVAFYSVGMRLIESLTVIALYFMNSVLPVLTQSLEKHDGKHQSIIQNAFDFLAMLGFALAAGGLVLAYPLVAIVSKPEYLSRISEGIYGSDIGLQILLFALMFSFINTLFSFVLISVNQQKKLLWINLGAIVMNLALNMLVIPKYGFRGAAVTSVIAECYILAVTFITAKKFLTFDLKLGNLAKIILSSVVMGAAVLFLRDPTFSLLENKNLLLLIPLGATIFAAMLWLTGVITRARLREVFKKDARAEPEIIESNPSQ